MPVSEADVGITELLGDHRPFRAVLKQTVDDFVVNEIMLSGETARLTQLPRPRPPRQRSKDANPVLQVTDLSKLPFEKLDSLFSESDAPSNLIREALEAEKSSVTLPACADKKVRTQIHGWVRDNLPGWVTDTIPAEGGQSVRLRKRDTCRPWKRKRADREEDSENVDASKDDTYDPREGKDTTYRSLHVGPNTNVQFLLWKRNRDTTQALSILGKILKLPLGEFSYAGTKDKRAVTTQLVQVRGVSEGRFHFANCILKKRDRGLRSMAIGNVAPAPRGSGRNLGLGDLRGNRFTLVLRDLELDESGGVKNVTAAVDSLRERGFINYFGLQRFGSGVSPTHETGFAVLRGDFEDVCRRILLPLRVEDKMEGMRADRIRFVSAMEQFSRGEIKAEQLDQELPRWMHVERAIVGSYIADEEDEMPKYDYKKAFASLPRNLQRMYVHAVQSYLWNVMASARLKRHGRKGDDTMYAVEGDVVPENEQGRRHYSHHTKVRRVSKEEEENKTVSIFRVLVPVPGSEVNLPDTEYATAARQVLNEQAIDLKRCLDSDFEFDMKGTYRPLLSKPCDLESMTMTYADRNVSLIQSGIEHLEEGKKSKKPEQNDPAKAPALTCGDDTQKSVVSDHVADGKENPSAVVAANGSDQKGKGELAGDCSNVRMNGKPSFEGVSNGEAIAEPSANALGQTIHENSNLDAADRRTALIISFTLRGAEYATMLVRELTRHDSSTANQKVLQNGVVSRNPKKVGVT